MVLSERDVVRTATFDGPGSEPVIHEVPRPTVPDNAAVIEIAACGVCGTDLHILKGHWPAPLPWPLTLGHELAGVIVDIGERLNLWGGFSEMVYVDLDQLPGTKIYRLPDDMSLQLATLSEPLTSCVRAFDRA